MMQFVLNLFPSLQHLNMVVFGKRIVTFIVFRFVNDLSINALLAMQTSTVFPSSARGIFVH